MATLREIRRRIAGIQSTQKITKAMKMVAAAKLRRAQDAVVAARPYAKAMRTLLRQIAARVDVTAHPLFTVRPVGKTLLVVMTSDRGLCGAFNASIIRTAVGHIRTRFPGWQTDGNLALFCIGKKGADFFTKNQYPVVARHTGIFSGLDFRHAQAITGEIVAGFLDGSYDRVEIVYNEFKSIIQQKVVNEQLLPIPPETLPDSRDEKLRPVNYLFEPSKDRIVEDIVPQHLRFQIWHLLLESSAAEQGARMTAMDNATTNATDLIRTLQLSYNKARQASITKELLEIVSGAEALKAAD